ncbi:hypothetical protein TCARB_0711 [Thermofilum adornatum 1505]|uniref:Uncharacterized protein n=1 Tax=Thermofilum adornatum 1505 TaxID=697581 RepID=A0A3G1A6K7_9CREN|nr:hypothetical protein TCARB_0711 [Thermofilum adornatum 1505]
MFSAGEWTLLRMVPCTHFLGKEFLRRKRGYYGERPENNLRDILEKI